MFLTLGFHRDNGLPALATLIQKITKLTAVMETADILFFGQNDNARYLPRRQIPLRFVYLHGLN